MSDDLVKRYSSYNIMMLGDSGNEVSTPDGEWVKYKDYKAQSARIEELEAELEKAMGFIQNSALRAMIEEHDEDERDMIDFDSLRFERDCDIVQARSTLAELKGETDER